MASNPRIDDLRKRLEKDPGSRLFAQLAEELRKAGELDEAISVSRDGLQKHGAYPSARMTLGRALFDKGDLAGARGELESVLKGAADNILASRLLAECLEGLGDLRGAVDRFRKTLAMAPGDRQMAGKVAALELRIESTTRVESVKEPPPPQAAPSEAPIPLVAADEAFELETSYEAPAPPFPHPEAEPVVAQIEAGEPELLATDEEVGDMPEVEVRPATADQPAIAAPDLPPPAELFEFDVPAETEDAPRAPDAVQVGDHPPVFDEGPMLVPAVADRLPTPTAAPDFVPQPLRMLPQSDEEPPPPWVAPPPVEAPAPELISSTLAELYFNQGFTAKAIEVYRQVLGREPGNDRAKARLGELEASVNVPEGVSPHSTGAVLPVDSSHLPQNGPALRRQAIERVIGRLEGLRNALRRG